MFKTFAVPASTLFDATSRAAWDKTLSDFERDVEVAGAGVQSVTQSVAGDAIVVTFVIAKMSVQLVNGQPMRTPSRMDESEFAASLARNRTPDRAPSMGDRRGPRVLGD